MTTGELIRKYRKEKRLTQQELAEKCGISYMTIRRLETNAREIKLENLLVIANKLEIPFSCLLGFNPEGYREKTLQDFTTDELLAEIKRRIEKEGQ